MSATKNLMKTKLVPPSEATSLGKPWLAKHGVLAWWHLVDRLSMHPVRWRAVCGEEGAGKMQPSWYTFQRSSIHGIRVCRACAEGVTA